MQQGQVPRARRWSGARLPLQGLELRFESTGGSVCVPRCGYVVTHLCLGVDVVMSCQVPSKLQGYMGWSYA